MQHHTRFFKAFSVLLCLFMYTYKANAQQINWFEPAKAGLDTQTIPVGSQEFYTWTPSDELAQSEGKLRHYSEIGLDKEGKIEFRLDKEKLWLIQFAKINDEFFAVLSLPQKDRITIYLQKILPGCVLVDEPKMVTEFGLSAQNAWVKTCSFVQSDNLKYFALCNFNAVSANGRASVPCKVFKWNLEKISETEIPLDYAGDDVQAEGHFVTNEGDLFINFKIRYPLDKNKTNKPLKDFHAYHLQADGTVNSVRFSELQMDLKSKQLKHCVPVGSKDGMLYVTGIFKEGIDHIGTYLFKINVAEKKMISFVFQNLTDQAGLSPVNNPMFSSAFDLLKIKQSEILKDESILVAIQIENEQATSATNSIYSYYDVIISKFTSDAQFSWATNIPFFQKVEKNDQIYGGFKGVIKRSEYVLLFNDSKSNYDEGGSFVHEENKSLVPYRAYTDLGTDPVENAVISSVVINLESGGNYRSLLGEGEENFKGFMLLPNNTKSTSKSNGIVQLWGKSKMRYGVNY